MSVMTEERVLTARVIPGALKMHLKFHQYNYRDLEALSGVSRSTISNIVTGKARQVNPETASKLAKALRVKTSDIFLPEVIHYSGSQNKAA